MENKDNGLGCARGIVLTIIFLILSPYLYEYFISDPKKERENINYWSEETVCFFNNFNLKSLERVNNVNVDVDKVFIIDTHLTDYIKGNINFKNDHYFTFNFGEKYTRYIKNANVIIWLRTIKGKSYGTYSNGETAIRLNTEVNFIEKKSNTIFKSRLFIHEGDPIKSLNYNIRNLHDYKKEKQERMEKGEHNIYFGKRPTEKIQDYIIAEIYSQ